MAMEYFIVQKMNVVVYACNPSTWESKGMWTSEFNASQIYRISSRIARATQRNPASNLQDGSRMPHYNYTDKGRDGESGTAHRSHENWEGGRMVWDILQGNCHPHPRG